MASRNRTKLLRLARKKKYVEILGGKCYRCGYNACLRALHFHHIDPLTKQFDISGSGRWQKEEVVIEELKKCVLVCSNCHAEVESSAKDNL